jgi:hypothetical protein
MLCQVGVELLAVWAVALTLGLTEPLVEITTRDLRGGKGGWCVGLTALPSSGTDY